MTIKLYEEMNDKITELLGIDNENPVERYASEYIKHLRKVVSEQNAEIERLTEELDDTVSMNEMYIKEVKQNAELQEQVDELTVEKENLYFLNKNLEDYIDNHEPIWKRNTEQAVKDTAKEIFTEIKESFVFNFKGSEDYKKGFCDALEQYDKQLRDLAKLKGVEAE